MTEKEQDSPQRRDSTNQDSEPDRESMQRSEPALGRSSGTDDSAANPDPSDGDDDGGDGGGDGNGGNGNGPEFPSDQELELLTFLWYLDTRAEYELTGFEAKNLYADVLGRQNAAETYAALKGEFVATRRDTDPYALTSDGRRIATEAGAIQETVIDGLVTTIRERVPGSDLLTRLFWLAHTDQGAFEWYRERRQAKLANQEQALVSLFDDEQLQSHREFGALLDELPDVATQVQAAVTDALNDEAYLKGFAVLHGEATVDILNVSVAESMNVGDTEDVLGLYLSENEVEPTVDELTSHGLGEGRNVFEVDVDALLEQNRDRLENLFAFDEEACREAFETHWDLILDLLSGFNGRSEAMQAKLAETGAVIPSGGQFEVRSETERVGQEILHGLKERVGTRLDEFDNVTWQLEFDRDEAMASDEDVVVVLHDKSWSSNQYYYHEFASRGASNPDQNPLVEKVILVPSPKEFGFTDPHLESGSYHSHGNAVEQPDANLEYNALGDVPDLTAVQEAFETCNWERVSRGVVNKAKEILEEQSQISREEAFDRIAEHGTPYVVGLYALARVNSATTNTSIDKRYYEEDHLWSDVEDTLATRYDSLSDTEITEIRETLEEILVDEAGINVVEFADADEVYHHFGNQLDDDLDERLAILPADEQELLYVALTYLEGNETTRFRGNDHQPKFNLLYDLLFEGSQPSNPDLADLLVGSGICTVGTYVDSSGDVSGRDYPFYHSVKRNPSRYRDALDVESTSASVDRLDDYTTVPQLAGIEFLLREGGAANRSDLRDTLMGLDTDAMDAFEFVSGIVAAREGVVIVNPTLEIELSNWVTEHKRRLVGNIDKYTKYLRAGDIADLAVNFDPNRGVYEGTLVTRDREEIDVVVAPWLTRSDADRLGQDVVAVLTKDYGTEFVEHYKSEPRQSLIITTTPAGLKLYRSLPHDKVVEPIIESFEETYEIISQEVEIDVESGERAVVEETDTKASGETESAVRQQKPGSITDRSVANEGLIAPPSTEGGVPETPLLEELFDTGELSFPGDLPTDRPVVVLVEKPEADRFGTTIQLLCRELYRQLQGGMPNGHVVDDGAEVSRDLRVGGQLEFVDENEGRFFKTDKVSDSGMESVNWTRFSHRLQEFDTQALGFLIVQLPTGTVSDFRQELQHYAHPHRPQIIEVRPRLPRDEYASLESYLEEAVPKADALWGQPGLKPDTSILGEGRLETFDEAVTLAERRAQHALNRTVREPIVDGTNQRSPTMVVDRHRAGDKGRPESQIHYALKTFVIRWLVESEGYALGAIETENSVRTDGNAPVPDVRVGPTVFEVETLYGAGMPTHAVKETVEKYRQVGDVSDIGIILPAVAGALHERALRRLQQEINETWNLRVQCLIPNLEESELADLASLRESFI